jgi:hypothetical protein
MPETEELFRKIDTVKGYPRILGVGLDLYALD